VNSPLELSEEEESIRCGKIKTHNGALIIQQFETTDADMEDMSDENNLNVEMH
jgi:hypothetical protein